MSWYEWRPYVPVAERRRQAERKLAKLRKQGHPVAPVTIGGRVIAKSFWGKSWCDNLERYSDYANRLPRGRTYVRNGSVVDLQIAKGKVTAMVAGSEHDADETRGGERCGFAALGAVFASGRSCPAWASSSWSSTSRCTYRSCGCSSSLAPTP